MLAGCVSFLFLFYPLLTLFPISIPPLSLALVPPLRPKPVARLATLALASPGNIGKWESLLPVLESVWSAMTHIATINTHPDAALTPIPIRPLFMAIPPSRPLRRQHAFIALTPAEQSIADVMVRPSPPPQLSSSALGKRPRRPSSGEEDDGDTTDTDTNLPSTASAVARSDTSNVNLLAPAPPPAATAETPLSTVLQSASKKLRMEQREEVDTFLKVRRSHLL